MKKVLITIAFLLPLALLAQGRFHAAFGTGYTTNSMYVFGYEGGWTFNNKFDVGWEFRLQSTHSDLKDQTFTKDWNGFNVGYNLTGKRSFQVVPYIGYYWDMASRIEGQPIIRTFAYRLKLQKSVSKGASLFIEAGHYKTTQFTFGINLDHD